ncbi:MAG TPA: hydantoinase B/oxoprolinase family protein, partial [Candidatus Binataceae bacterium]|nr:hydantoinase B/oxoprolinase family protein [Candidatus Binataceae bacterium]
TEIGEPILFAPYIQYFAGVSDLVIRWTLENRGENPGIFDGDVFFQNDPLIGVSHQMDVQTFAPVFVDGRIFCWVFNSVHVRDIGGTSPGSFCVEARDVYGEATPIPPIKLVERGNLRRDVEEMIRRHSRIPDLLGLDLRSQLAGIHAARTRVLEMVRAYGAATVKAVMRKLISDTSAVVAARLRRLPNGTWRDVSYIGAATAGDRHVHRLALTMRKAGDRLIFSNEGTDPQFGCGNISWGAWRAAVGCSVSALLAWDQRYCLGGVLKHLEFNAVPGTINCIDRSGAVSGTQAIISTVYQAAKVVSRMVSCDPELKKNVMGPGSATTWTTMSGLDQFGHPYASVTLDEVAMGSAGFSFRDGNDQCSDFVSPRIEAADCEVIEQTAPVLYLYRREFHGFGHGKYRGGSGIVLGWVGHDTREQSVNAVSGPSSMPTQTGIWGGHWGQSGLFYSRHDAGIRADFERGVLPGSTAELDERYRLNVVPPKSVGVRLLGDDIWVMAMASGGGYGDPIKRDPELVRRDVAARTVSAEIAGRIYGVVLREGAVDEAATRHARQMIRQARLARASKPAGSNGSAPPHNGGPVVERYAVGEELKLVSIGEASFITCADCGHLLCGAGSNYKLSAARIDGSLHEIDPDLFPEPETELDDPIAYRQYLCPNCGVLFDNELAKAEDPPVWDVQLG